jgi:phage-related protein
MSVDLKVSGKNLLDWSHMEDWENGASAAPTGHTLSGAGASVAREATTIKHGTYSAAVTRAGADTTLYYDFTDYASYLGRKMTFGCWVYASVANRARLSISDAVGSTESSYHTGVAGWEFLTVTRNVDASATRIRVEMQVNTGNTTAYFDSAILVEGAVAFLDISGYAESWDLSRKYRNSKFTVARRSGVLVPDVDFGENTLSIKGKVWGTSSANARTTWDSFLQYMNEGEKDIYLYDDRFVRGFLVNESHKYIAALRVVEFTLQFIVQNPFNLYIQKLRTTSTVDASPKSFTVTNNGNVFNKPTLNFTAGSVPITSLVLANLTSGENMVFSGTVAAYTTLVIDCENLTVMNNGVDSIASFTGDFIKLNAGTNAMKFTGTTLTTVKVDVRDRWL